MHLKAEDPQAAKIQAVFVNNKKVAMPVELDTDQGWVDVLIPALPSEVSEGKPGDDSDPAEFQYKRVRLNGSVHIVWSK